MSIFKQAAEELLSRRKAGTKAPRLVEAIRPKSIDDALAIQAEMANMEATIGWKCLLPPAEGKIVAAPIFNLQHQTDDVVLFADKGQALIEPEIGFVLAKDLPARSEDYSEQEVVEAIGSAHMALELMQRRFEEGAGQDFYESLSDCMINQGVYIGPEIDKGLAVNAHKVAITITQSSQSLDLDGTHPNPRAIDGFVWLVNFMSKRGISFSAEQVFITGSFKGIVPLEFDQKTVVRYDGLGEYSVTFKAK